MNLFLFFAFYFLNVTQTHLEKRTLLDGKVEILVPVQFKEMSQEMLDFKYKGNNKPTFVLTDSNAAVNLAFIHLPNKTTESSIKAYKDAAKASFEKSFPNAKWIADGIHTVNGKSRGYLKLITQGIDQNIYNYLV